MAEIASSMGKGRGAWLSYWLVGMSAIEFSQKKGW